MRTPQGAWRHLRKAVTTNKPFADKICHNAGHLFNWALHFAAMNIEKIDIIDPKTLH